MKRLLIRTSIVGIVLGLGGFVLVQAQRSHDRPAEAGEMPTRVQPVAPEPIQRSRIPSAGMASLGRGTAAAVSSPPSMSTTFPNGDPRARPADAPVGVSVPAPDDIPDANPNGMPAAQPTGTVERYAQSAPAGDPMQSPRTDPRVVAAAGAPATGAYDPLSAGAADRYAATGGRNDLRSQRYTASAASATAELPAEPATRDAADPQEPKRLTIDPFAAPAAPLRPDSVPRGNAAAPSTGTLAAGIDPLAGSSRRLIPASGTGPATDAAPPGSDANDPASGGEGNGRPGAKNLEGPQSPQLTIQKIAPPEIQVGKPAVFRIVVRNTGTVSASSVEIHDQVPKGTKVVSTSPRASRGVRGDLVWSVGTVKPNDEVAVEVQLMPVAEGEIGSVATVQFNADASARTVATKPQLAVEMSLADRVQIGDDAALKITVSNPGTGVATGVVLEEHIPAGLEHPAGTDLEYEVGQLQPGESRKLDLVLKAARPGQLVNVLTARADGNIRVEERRNIEVTAPQLQLAIDGAKKRYLEREGTYQISIANPGTAAAQKIELVAFLPSGLKFVSANNSGMYDDANRAVHWRLEELPVNETGTVELVTLPTEAGQQTLKLHTTAERGVVVEKEHPVIIEGIAAILFQVTDTVDPIEVGGETTYEVKIVNQGSKAAANVRLAVTLPPELKFLTAEGPTQFSAQGTGVLFEGLARLAPKAETTYRIRVQGVRPGDLRTRIQVMTDEMQTPVTKEESTRVFADE